MLNTFRGAWTWFVEGLVEALLRLVDATRRSAPLRIALGDGAGEVTTAGGSRLGRLSGEGSGFSPPDLARRLSGGSVDLVIPDGWMQRRQLEPVAVASRPFLDAFVRHQIERITPWRVADAHYRILDRPLPDDPARLAVAVAVVPKRLVAEPLAALQPLHLRAVRLRCAGDVAGAHAIPVGGGRPQFAARLRTGVVWGLAALALAVVGSVAVCEWQASLVRDDIDAQDAVLAQRKAVIARARRGGDAGSEAAAGLRALRDGRKPAVAVLDALAAALPDSAHLSALSIEADRLTVAGLSTAPSALVPALETSGAFADVAFGAATTPAEGGIGDRFSLEMRIVPPRSDHGVSPPDAARPGTGP